MNIYTALFLFQLHNRCASHVNPECRLGPNRVHILPPTSICPTVLDRQRSVSKEKHSNKGSFSGSKKDNNGGSGEELTRSESIAGDALTTSAVSENNLSNNGQAS